MQQLIKFIWHILPLIIFIITKNINILLILCLLVIFPYIKILKLINTKKYEDNSYLSDKKHTNKFIKIMIFLTYFKKL